MSGSTGDVVLQNVPFSSALLFSLHPFFFLFHFSCIRTRAMQKQLVCFLLEIKTFGGTAIVS